MSPHSPQEFQAAYYARTGGHYDELHVAEGDEHYEALAYVSESVTQLGLASLLDLGSGTGRALAYLRSRHPQLKLTGVEPVPELLELALARPELEQGDIVNGSGERLPFADGSFDAVAEFGVLHHVAEPGAVVAEMMRVARRAVFLSDTNRFGYGRYPMRLVKLALYRAGLWRGADWLHNGGHAYRVTDDDGLFYSYSVYDSYRQLAAWADRVVLIPTRPATGLSWQHPLLTTTHILLSAFRDEG